MKKKKKRDCSFVCFCFGFISLVGLDTIHFIFIMFDFAGMGKLKIKVGRRSD